MFTLFLVSFSIFLFCSINNLVILLKINKFISSNKIIVDRISKIEISVKITPNNYIILEITKQTQTVRNKLLIQILIKEFNLHEYLLTISVYFSKKIYGTLIKYFSLSLLFQ